MNIVPSVYAIQEARKRAASDPCHIEYAPCGFLYSHLRPEDKVGEVQPFRYMKINGEIFPIEEGERRRDSEAFIDLTPVPAPHRFQEPGVTWQEKVDRVLDKSEESW